MNIMAQLCDRPVRVELSKKAARICARRTCPLLVEMELRFGRLVTKRTYFRDAPSDSPGIQIDPCLYLDFGATATSACNLEHNSADAAYTVKPVANIRRYVPSWCHIDYTGGQWSCEFGYDRNQSDQN